ncbi:MAG: hypothetical protein M3P34_01855 [Actinomycetota bacterium]|nr:hypothetical protein [Actinomycetota bacterium]
MMPCSEARAGAGRLLAARAGRLEYDPDRIGRFGELASYLADVPAAVEVPDHLPAIAEEASASLPFLEAYFSRLHRGHRVLHR